MMNKNLKKELVKKIFKDTGRLFFSVILIELTVIIIITIYLEHIPLIIASLTKNHMSLTWKYIRTISIVLGISQILRYGIQYPIFNKIYQRINNNGKNISYDYFSKAKMDKIDDETYLKVNLITENINNTIFNVHVFFKDKIQGILFIIYSLLKNTPTIGIVYISYMLLLYYLGQNLMRKIYISGEEITLTRNESKEFTNDLSRNFFLHKLFNLDILNKSYFNKLIKKENEALNKNFESLRFFLFIVNGLNLLNIILLVAILTYINISLVVKGKIAFAVLRGMLDINGVVLYTPAFLNEISRITESLKLFDIQLEIEKKELNIDYIEDIKINHISYIYKEKNNLTKHISKEIFNDFSHEFKKGINFIKGFSGSGKSTLLKIMIGLYEIQKGDVIINNNYSVKKYNFLSKITYITQSDLIFNRTIKENILLNHDENSLYKDYIHNTKIENIINKCAGISGSLISGGECKRIAIGRSLICYKEGNVVIFDEPFVGLDNELIDEIIKIIINFKNNIVIVIDHTQSLEKYLITNKIFFYELKIS